MPQPFFHAQAPDSGLGIPELLVQVPVKRHARVKKLFDRATWLRDPVMVAAIGKSKVTPPGAKALGRWSAVLQPKCDGSNRPGAVHCDRLVSILPWLWFGLGSGLAIKQVSKQSYYAIVLFKINWLNMIVVTSHCYYILQGTNCCLCRILYADYMWHGSF